MKRSSSCLSACNIPGIIAHAGANGPESVLDRSDEDPLGDAFGRKFEIPGDSRDQAFEFWHGDGIGQQRADQMRGIEGRVTHQRLGIDHEPWLPPGSQDIAEVKIAIRYGAVCIVSREFAAKFEDAVEQALGEWTACIQVLGRQHVFVLPGHASDLAKGMGIGRRHP